MQQSSAWTGVLKSAVREGSTERNVRRTFKMLKEVWLNIGVEKINMYKGITVKALLNSGATEMFMDWKMTVKYRFRLQKLKRPIVVKNVDRPTTVQKLLPIK